MPFNALMPYNTRL